MISGRPHADHLGIGQRAHVKEISPACVVSCNEMKKPSAKPPIKICMKSGFNCSCSLVHLIEDFLNKLLCWCSKRHINVIAVSSGEILASTCMCALRVTCPLIYVCECGGARGHTARFTFVSTRKPLNSIALTGILCGHRRKYKLHTGRVVWDPLFSQI
jgi:hypothetical protein